MRANELTEDGPNLGTRIFKSLGKKLSNLGGGGPLNQLSKTNLQAQQHVIDDIVQRAKMNLEQGIQSGIISTDDLPSEPTQDTDTQQTSTQQTDTSVPLPNPEQARQEKQAQAAQTAQKQMKPAPATVNQEPQQALSPEQVRQQKQAQAAQAARAQMKTVPEKPKQTQIPPTPTVDQVNKSRQQFKQQSQQAQTPPTPGFTRMDPNQPPPAPKSKKFDTSKATDASVKKPGSRPAQPTPNYGAQQPYQTKYNVPTGNFATRPQAPTPGASVPSSPQNPVTGNFPKLGFKESTIDEAQAHYTISSYLQGFLKKYLPGVDTSMLKSFCDDVQSTYKQDKGDAALRKLASAAFSIYSAADKENSASKAVQTASNKLVPTNTNRPATLATARDVLSKLGPKNKAAIYNDLKAEFAGKEPRIRKTKTEVPSEVPSAPNDNIRRAENQTQSTIKPAKSTKNSMINPDGSITIAGAKGAAPSKMYPTDPMYKSLRAAIEKGNQTATESAITENKSYKVWGKK